MSGSNIFLELTNIYIYVHEFLFARLRTFGQPYIAYHPGLIRDALAFHGCAELFQVNFPVAINDG